MWLMNKSMQSGVEQVSLAKQACSTTSVTAPPSLRSSGIGAAALLKHHFFHTQQACAGSNANN
jgi:hypothetical protein